MDKKTVKAFLKKGAVSLIALIVAIVVTGVLSTSTMNYTTGTTKSAAEGGIEQVADGMYGTVNQLTNGTPSSGGGNNFEGGETGGGGETDCTHPTTEIINASPTYSGDTICTVCHRVLSYGNGSTQGCSHTNTELKNVKEATCTVVGFTGDTYCIDCDEKINAGSIIPEKGHTEIALSMKPATCTATGLTAGSKCSVCNMMVKAQTIIPAKGHIDATLEAKAATCIETGLNAGKKCSVCGVITLAQTVIPAKGHGATEIKNKTAIYTGDTYCKVCNKIISEGEYAKAITYSANGGLFDTEISNVAYYVNGAIYSGEYKIPTRIGYTFAGWYKDMNCTNGKEFNINTDLNSLTADIIVYAKWSENSVILTTGSAFNSAIPSTATEVIFTCEAAPIGAETVDLSAKGDNGIVGWSEGSTFKVSTQRLNKKVIAGSNLSGMFLEKRNISNIDLTALDTSATTNMSSMFKNTGRNTMKSFTMNADVLNVSNVTNMDSMFYSTGRGATDNWTIGNLDNYNVSKVTDMDFLFYYTANVAPEWNVGTLSNWNVSNVKTMSNMFYGAAQNATGKVALDLSKWDVSKVSIMDHMFAYFGNATRDWSIGDISNWNTSKVTTFASFMQGAGAASTSFNVGDLSTKVVYNTDGTSYHAWDVANSTTFSCMFYAGGGSGPTFNIGNIGNWNTTKVKNFDRFLATASNALNDVSIDLSTKQVTLEDGTTYTAWNVENATSMYSMFYMYGYRTPYDINLGDLSTWNISKLENMGKLFMLLGETNAQEIHIGDISNWDTSNVKNIELALSFDHVVNIENWDLSNVTNSHGLFFGNDRVEHIIIPASLKTIGSTFTYHCSRLKTVEFKHSATDIIEMPEPGYHDGGEITTSGHDDIMGAFYVDSTKPLSVITENDTVKNYDWSSDNRTITFKEKITYLLKQNEHYNNVTGGWTFVKWDAQSGSATNNGLYSVAYAGEGAGGLAWYSTNKIDLTEYTKVKAIATSNMSLSDNINGDGLFRIGVYTSKTADLQCSTNRNSFASIANQDIVIEQDISDISGEYYIKLMYQGGRSAKVYFKEVWLESETGATIRII